MNTPSDTSVVEQLRARGFDAKHWNMEPDKMFLQITDLRTAATVYVPESSTLEHCLEMISTKNKAFAAAGTTQKQEGKRA